MIRRVNTALRSSIARGDSPHSLACTIALGVYVAFSPFIGFHTIMVFVFAWVFGLNLPIMFATSNLVNNPWTMVPVYASGYACGDWMLHSLLRLDTMYLNPAWMVYFNSMLNHYVGLSHISLWAFMIGGNLLGILAGLMVYPVAKLFLGRLSIASRPCA